MNDDLATAVCLDCRHAEPVSLGAWLHGQTFEHCGKPMRIHVDSPEQASQAIDKALEEGVEQHQIVSALVAGITDDPVEGPSRRTVRAGMGGLREQLLAQTTSTINTEHQLRTTPLQTWAAAASLRLMQDSPPEEHTIVITAGPIEDGTEAIAITAINHAEHPVRVARLVVVPPPEPTDAWLAGYIGRVRDLIDQ